LRFGTETPVCAHILPPFIAFPGVHISLSGYNGALTLAAVTPQNGRGVVDGFLNALLEQLPSGEVTLTENGLEASSERPEADAASSQRHVRSQTA